MSRTVLSFLAISLLLTGCGKGVSVSGKVTFPDNSPLTKGMVVFQSPTMVSKGSLSPTGYYTVPELKPGVYSVYLSGAGAAPEGFVPPEGSDDSGYRSFVADEYLSVNTSPLKCDTTKSRSLDFVVKPSEVYAKERGISAQ